MHYRKLVSFQFLSAFEWASFPIFEIILKFRAIGVCCPSDLNGQNEIPAFPQRADDLPLLRHAGDVAIKDSNPIERKERGCGLSTKSYSKIFGGRPADPSEWPWMAGIKIKYIKIHVR